MCAPTVSIRPLAGQAYRSRRSEVIHPSEGGFIRWPELRCGQPLRRPTPGRRNEKRGCSICRRFRTRARREECGKAAPVFSTLLMPCRGSQQPGSGGGRRAMAVSAWSLKMRKAVTRRLASAGATCGCLLPFAGAAAGRLARTLGCVCVLQARPSWPFFVYASEPRPGPHPS